MRFSLAVLLLSFAALPAFAQLAPTDPDWKEVDAPPPPPLRTSGLVPLDVPRSELRFGIDPDSISIGADSVVRYVIVAAGSGGAVNAMYEGLRCSTSEVKLFARHDPVAGWRPVKDAEWRTVIENPATRHSREFARAGACMGRVPNRHPSAILRDLKSPLHEKFEPR